MDDILKEMSPRFAKLYANTGRPSIPPERLLRALLLQILYTVRSERRKRSSVTVLNRSKQAVMSTSSSSGSIDLVSENTLGSRLGDR